MGKEQLRSAGIYTDISPSAVRVCCCDGENEWLTPVVLDVKPRWISEPNSARIKRALAFAPFAQGCDFTLSTTTSIVCCTASNNERIHY